MSATNATRTAWCVVSHADGNAAVDVSPKEAEIVHIPKLGIYMSPMTQLTRQKLEPLSRSRLSHQPRISREGRLYNMQHPRRRQLRFFSVSGTTAGRGASHGRPVVILMAVERLLALLNHSSETWMMALDLTVMKLRICQISTRRTRLMMIFCLITSLMCVGILPAERDRPT